MFTFTVKIAGTFVVLEAEPAAANATTVAHTAKMTLPLTASKVAAFLESASRPATGRTRSMLVSALISVWTSTAVVVVVIGVLRLVLGRDNSEASSSGLSASWWGVTALICFGGGVAGLLKGLWAAAALLIPAVFAARRATRARNRPPG
jgi:hypothetical protein